MSRVMKIALLIFSFAVTAFNPEGFTMAKRYTHFVDANYEGEIIKGQPNGQKGTRWSYDKQPDFHVTINYPADHRVEKWPLTQWTALEVGTFAPKPLGTFKILNLKLINNKGREVPVKFEVKDLGNYKTNEFKTYGLPISFFSDIPKDVENLVLEFKVEVKLAGGQTHIVEESVSLKRAYFEG